MSHLANGTVRSRDFTVNGYRYGTLYYLGATDFRPDEDGHIRAQFMLETNAYSIEAYEVLRSNFDRVPKESVIKLHHSNLLGVRIMFQVKLDSRYSYVNRPNMMLKGWARRLAKAVRAYYDAQPRQPIPWF